MKYTILLLALALAVLPAPAMQIIFDQFPNSNNATLAQAELHGPVQVVRSYAKKGGILIEELRYDAHGRLIGQTSYAADGQVRWQTTQQYDADGHAQPPAGVSLRYDDHGNVIERTVKAPTPGDNASTTTAYTYGPQGQVLRKEEKNSGGGKLLQVYNAQGQLLEFEFVPVVVPGKYRTGEYAHYKNTCNARGACEETTCYDEKGHLTSRTTFAYTAAGKPRTESTVDAAGLLTRKVIYRYDAAGREIACDTFSYTGKGTTPQLTTQTTHTYTATGRLTDMHTEHYNYITSTASMISYSVDLTKDANGKEHRKIGPGRLVPAPATPTRYTAEILHWHYDAHGNATQMPPSGYPQAITYREITYNKS